MHGWPGRARRYYSVRVVVFSEAWFRATAFLRTRRPKRLGSALPAPLTFDQIQAIADRVTQAYRLAGFIVATAIVPPQVIEAGGTLTLQVVGHRGDSDAVGDGLEGDRCAEMGGAAWRHGYDDLESFSAECGSMYLSFRGI